MAVKAGTAKPDLIVVGLDSRRKQRHFAGLTNRRSERFNLERALSRLSEIRRHTLCSMDSLKTRFVQRGTGNGDASVFPADDAERVVAYVDRVVGQRRVLAVNKANVIKELKPTLERNGYRLIDTYFAGLPQENAAEKVLNDYWQLPVVPIESAYESFAVERLSAVKDRKDYTALLGVAAAAAEDGSIYFLQHGSNVSTALQEAGRLILIVGTEKIVETRDEALFQTKCMGAFGLESVILDMKCAGRSHAAGELENLASDDFPQDIHVIVLDNGRSDIATAGDFGQLLTCIGCRACARHCPTHSHFDAGAGSYPRQYLWSFLRGDTPLLDLCTGCGMCHLDCPLDINIPHLVSVARSKGLDKWRHLMRNKLLHDPWPLMRMASRAGPLANLFLNNKLIRISIEGLVGFQREAWIPNPRHRTFDQWIHLRR